MTAEIQFPLAAPAVLPLSRSISRSSFSTRTCSRRWRLRRATGSRTTRCQPAFPAWEANGPGQEFQKRVLETDFRDFFYRKQADVATKRSTNKPGYWTQKRSELLGPYREALMEGQYVNPDAAALEELRQYSIGPDGEPFHNAENQKDDPTGAKKANADRVAADAVGWIAAYGFRAGRRGHGAGGAERDERHAGEAPLGSYAWRVGSTWRRRGRRGGRRGGEVVTTRFNRRRPRTVDFRTDSIRRSVAIG